MFNHQTRATVLETLKGPTPQKTYGIYDVLVLGGGITGCAVAREAASRGLSVFLVEKGDFAEGTSSRSSRLVHGGVRYLENLDFRLVHESTRERALLWKNAEQLVKPLGFVFPGFTESRHSLGMLNIGLWLYDTLALFRLPSLHRRLSKKSTLEHIPALRENGLKGSIFYWDAQTHDARLTLANALDATQLGAKVTNYTCLKNITLNKDVPNNHEAFHTGHLEDVLNGNEYDVKFRTLVAAAGPWTDRILSPWLGTQWNPIMKTTRGSHIVVSAKRLSVKHAVVQFHPKDGRVLFTIPWGEFTIIGTTDIFDDETPETTKIESDEVSYLIEASHYYFPKNPLTFNDVISTWSGLRPLVMERKKDARQSESKLSRDHHLEWIEPGVTVITGGKLTTHREMAEQTVDKLFDQTLLWSQPLRPYQPSPTYTRKLPRLQEYSPTSSEWIGQSEAGRLSLADIQKIIQEQMVLRLNDLMIRRTDLFYKEPQNGWDLLEKIKPIICQELGWSPARWTQECSYYQKHIEENVSTPLNRKFTK